MVFTACVDIVVSWLTHRENFFHLRPLVGLSNLGPKRKPVMYCDSTNWLEKNQFLHIFLSRKLVSWKFCEAKKSLAVMVLVEKAFFASP